MQKPDPLIRTKLRLPFTRAGLVARARLREQVAQGLRGPLTLVIAPAGFGKTTLVASSIAGCGMPVAWLSLDKNDNQTGRFLHYLVAALQEAGSTIGNEAAQLVASPQQATSEAVLTSLINDLDSASGDMILVLDDYQFIHSQAVHEELAFLIEHCPKTLHLLIASRSDLPLPLARLRARSHVVELRAADMRFTESEATQFLNNIMGLHLDAGSVAMLEERTEGWAAGLQMAALSMRDREDVRGFIEGFSGTNRYILDYLLEEVLAGQPTEVQHFLLCTSILERLAAPLCDAVLANDEGSQGEGEDRGTRSESPFPRPSASILEYLERANLFLVNLDEERQWYRYHHLFADLLRARLDKLHPGLSPQLHARASAWLEHTGIPVEAVNHALAAGDYARAARLVEENTTRLLAQGELNALMSWIEALPEELRLRRPWLCIHQAYALRLAGRTAEVESLLAKAETALDAAPAQIVVNRTGQVDKSDAHSMDMTDARTLKGAVAAVRAFTAVTTGKDAEAISLARHARELLPAEDLWNRTSAAWALGFALHSQGHLSEARSAFEEMVQLGGAMGNIWALVNGLTDLARVARDQGKIRQARAFLEEALTEASRKGARNLGFVARTEIHLASVLYELNELEAAQRLLSDALTHTCFWPNPNYLAMIYVCQAQVLLAQGDLQGARAATGEADQIRRSALLTRWLQRIVEADRVRMWLALQAAGIRFAPGDPLAEQSSALVASWRSELRCAYASLQDSDDTLMEKCADIPAITLTRVMLAAGQDEEALILLELVTRCARAAGHIGTAIGSLILTAIASQGKSTGRSNPALTALEEALSLAEDGGYVRLFLDEGWPMQMLIAQWLAREQAQGLAREQAQGLAREQAHANIRSPLRDYAIRLLSQFDAGPHGVPAAQEKASPAGDPPASPGQALVEPEFRPANDMLVEALSPRELEVLHLLALGRTNQEIARQLIVSPGTVKAHTASIYRKLEVANRTETAARARQLGILP